MLHDYKLISLWFHEHTANNVMMINSLFQGLQWYTRGLKIDEDGDVADQFLEEVLTETVAGDVPQNTWSKFEVKLITKSAKARNPCLSKEGTVQHYVRYHGQRQLIG
ncbi:hypothetical protein HanHA300_Chr13g0494531 [Helianthus annuus]|nr:hypothetical protein HanHA300_Chr13g0494531 [Helianthus annuus]KAJ0498766.1 hypothetical protein HanHA89_Chr13g0526651 [Helianthus annuus]KAJ0664786.1 hypothetical protein HanLR1_Chr13g0496721 [Helianthus annuus]KAJ0672227.1 hypothetical protein HanOQP8_Chr13g0494901 [Helianthus annuus]